MATHQPRPASAVPGERFTVLDPATGETFAGAAEGANGTGFGLSGSGRGTGLGRAEEATGRLGHGTAWTDPHAEPSPARPFTGPKGSGAAVVGGSRGRQGNPGPFVVHRPQEA
ncbi:hypothetical protein SUDANB58_05238 [Streptomyces sp. enrichment culture]